MAGLLDQADPMALLPTQQSLLGPVFANPLMMRQMGRIASTQPPKLGGPQSWGEYGQMLNQNLQQNFPTNPRDPNFNAAVRNVANTFAPMGITVFHGSPHKFDAFDMSKIGTGEGAQAYGHGLYFAEAPDVAKSYQSALSADRGFSYGGKTGLTRAQVQELVNAERGGFLDGVTRPSGVADSVMDDMVLGVQRKDGAIPRQYKPGSERAKVYEELRQQIKHSDAGALYKVDLPDDQVAKMLDWDKPLSQQSKEAMLMAQDLGLGGKATGKELYNTLFMQARDAAIARGDNAATSMQAAQAKASSDLKALGIPGIRYLDGGSRGTGAGTSNFVVFDDKLPKIIGRE